MISQVEHIELRKPSKKEIDKITTKTISQVHNNYNFRNKIVNSAGGNSSSIFIKDITHKMKGDTKEKDQSITKNKETNVKKWEPKRNVQNKSIELVKADVGETKGKYDDVKLVDNNVA